MFSLSLVVVMTVLLVLTLCETAVAEVAEAVFRGRLVLSRRDIFAK